MILYRLFLGKNKFKFSPVIDCCICGGGVQTITIIIITAVLVAEPPGKSDFPTMLSGGLRGRRKGDPNTSVVGKAEPSQPPVNPTVGLTGG